MNNFTSVKISEIGRVVTGKTPPTRDKTNYGSEYMFIGPTDLHQHFVINNSQKTISEKGISCIKGSILNQLSILVGCIGWDMGNVALVKEKCATNQQINSITDVKDQYNPYYIYYWLTGKKEFLFQQANVTRTPILNKTDFSKIEIPIPEKQQQDKISSVLTALDDKIALNNKINAELEGMAKLLYDYWFIQYDFPISAEQAKSMGDPTLTGKPYKSNGGPLTHNKTLKRNIPKGWEAKTVDDISDLNSNSWTTKNTPDQVHYVDLANTKNGMINATEKYVWEDAPSRAKRILKQGDTIIATVRPGNRSFALVPETAHELTGSTGFAVLTPHSETLEEFLYLTTTSDRNIATLTKIADSATSSYPSITPDAITSQKLSIPEDQILKQFSNLIKPMFLKIHTNQQQNQELTTLRDWLLPMLMNGQVTVK